MNTRPFFSVIICTYNRASVIQQALDSLVQQKDTHWEGLIIDDGSIDDTRKAVEPYLEKYPIQYWNKKHSGLAKTRNYGIARAKGKYVTFLDSDDRYTSRHLASRYKILTEHPEIDLLHSTVEVIGDPFVPDRNDPAKKIHLNDCIIGGTFFIKREKLTQDEKFKNRYSDDSFFLEQVRAKGWHISKVDAPTYIYDRTLPDSLTNKEGTS